MDQSAVVSAVIAYLKRNGPTPVDKLYVALISGYAPRTPFEQLMRSTTRLVVKNNIVSIPPKS